MQHLGIDLPTLIKTAGYLGIFGITFAESGLFVGILGDKKERDAHIREALHGLELARKILMSKKYDVIILDEILSAATADQAAKQPDAVKVSLDQIKGLFNDKNIVFGKKPFYLLEKITILT
jgi:hypothetical protein